ncbi:disease resistance protein RPS2 [Eucalyptus grandis]|uniref:disease resistance protein RPS2 n=1 Tax=Eucalyptus grandis TaxID=71139 RepID=UPI00192EE26A|nr:disease resistance protein RPS2 [Eucalyptus grandis]
MIVKANVSQTLELKKIQDDIAYFFGLKLKDEPSERLQKDPSEKILIILDDLRNKLDLKAARIPSGDKSMKCKLLLTLRYKDVLEKEMGTDRTFLLQGLRDDEAFRLFESEVGDQLNEELKPLAYQVVKKLEGLPLLIISVARTLKYSQLPAWRNMLIKIEDSNIETIVQLSYEHLESKDARSLFLLYGLIGGTIPVELLLGLGMGLGLFECYSKTIKDSRDRLKTTLDSLHSICLLQDGDDDKENVIIHDLYSEVVVSTPFSDQNSLMTNSKYGLWSKEKLEKCWARFLADVDKKRLDELMKCQFLYLKILMLSQPEDWFRVQEDEHEVEDCSELLDFTYMKELRVLYFRSMHIASLPSSIGILGDLHSLYLDDCNVEDVTILGKLKALQILSFARSTIPRLPKEIGKLTNLRSLNLRECYKLKTIESGVLKGLTNLEELHIYSFSQWMVKDRIPSESCNARLAELKSLTKLSALAISIPNPTILLKDGDLPFGNLDRFEINIGLVVGLKFKDLRIMELKLEGCESILSKEWVQKTLQKTQHLTLCKLSEFKRSAHELCTQGFEELKYINIEDRPSIKYFANSSDGLPLTAFRKLESLMLKNLIKLEKICNGLVTLESFSKLRVIGVTQCDRLKYLWSLSDWQRLVQLEKIEVWKCNSMQSIVTHDVGEGIVSTNNRVELPKVRHLNLFELPNLTSFCTKVEITSEDTPVQAEIVDEGGGDEGTELVTTTSDLQILIQIPSSVECSGSCSYDFASLEDLKIVGCRNFGAFILSPTNVKRRLGEMAEENDELPQLLFNEMVTFPNITSLEINGLRCKELWNNQIPPESFQKLESLELNNCDNLQRIVTFYIWKKLQ